ncbi:MAG TPA: DUF4221 family protein [Bacteroidia bacterium]|nr:DUF4221 family protein [Bacteroidia bacterium]
MRIKFAAIFLIFIIAGCGSNVSKTVVLEENERKIILLPDSSLAEFSSLNTFSLQNGSGVIALYDIERHSELFFNEKGKELSRIILHYPDSLSGNDPMLFVEPLGMDSILAIWPSMKSVFLFNAKGEIARQFNATTELNDGQKDYSLIAMDMSPIKSDGKTIYITCTRLDVVVRSQDARKKYFSTPPDISINLLNPEQQENTGIWPEEYKAGVLYRDYYPQRCVNGKGEIVYGFTASDSVYVLKNNKTISKHYCKSRFMTERHPYPDDSLGHFSFLERYDIIEPRYIGLTYDPYRNYYYRIVFHAITYEKPDGLTVNTYADKPWSLMIMDENFSVLNEIVVDNKRFLPEVFPVKDGLLFKQRQEKNNLPPVTFSLFKFQ